MEESVLCLVVLFLATPLMYSARRWLRSPRVRTDFAAWSWQLTLKSTLAFALAFNLIFFIQELFLVLPKALTPGLEPTLFHNNHDWRGHRPIEELLQGTGAMATVTAGIIFGMWLKWRTPAGDVWRLVLFWLALLGFLAALPQVVIGAVLPRNDVGRAMRHLGMPPIALLLASGGAFIAMALACWRLTPYLLSVADRHGSPRRRAGAAFRIGVLPCLFAIPLIVPFRIPGATIEVLFPPIVDALVAAVWIQASAWHVSSTGADPARVQPLNRLFLALGCLLAFFQLVLARGIDFF